MKLNDHSALTTHCMRVAAYCDEIAIGLRFPPGDRRRLRQAALLHHASDLSDNEFGRILTDLAYLSYGSHTDHKAIATNAASTLSGPLSNIVEMADQLDEALEFAPFGDLPLSDLINLNPDNHPAVSFATRHLKACSSYDVESAIPLLPVLPAHAAEILRLFVSPGCQMEQLIALARRDPVLTGSVLSAANSALYARAKRETNLVQAAVFLGSDMMRRVLVTASLKPLLARGMNALWRHSVEAAQVAEKICIKTGMLSPPDAYVLGLVHDVGQLLIRILPSSVLRKRERLIEQGVSPAVSELLTCGMEHAEAGAAVLRHWGFPEDYAVAVRFHHEPERAGHSPMASLLYLVEFWTASEEDLPSNRRLSHALELAGMDLAELQELRLRASAVESIV